MNYVHFLWVYDIFHPCRLMLYFAIDFILIDTQWTFTLQLHGFLFFAFLFRFSAIAVVCSTNKENTILIFNDISSLHVTVEIYVETFGAPCDFSIFIQPRSNRHTAKYIIFVSSMPLGADPNRLNSNRKRRRRSQLTIGVIDDQSYALLRITSRHLSNKLLCFDFEQKCVLFWLRATLPLIKHMLLLKSYKVKAR